MKKLFISLCIAIILIVAFLSGCGSLSTTILSDDTMEQADEQSAFATGTAPDITEDSMLSTFDSNFQESDASGLPTVDDEPDLSVIQTTYSLSDLTAFFGNHAVRVYDVLKSDHEKTITLEQANEAFPIEVLRSGRYAVYRVTEGGFFFVFFNWVLTEDDLDKFDPRDNPWGRWEEAPVYVVGDSFFMDVLPNIESFSSIEPGVSTAQDVLNVENRTVFGLALSSCTYSHTLLSDGSILEISYQDQSDIETDNFYQRLIVDTIQVYQQSELSKDLSRDTNHLTILVFVLPQDIEAVQNARQSD